MSFNARLPSASGNRRGRPYGNRPRGPPGVAKSEDVQPNELLSKRNVTAPPIIRTSAPPLPRGRFNKRGATPSASASRYGHRSSGDSGPSRNPGVNSWTKGNRSGMQDGVSRRTGGAPWGNSRPGAQMNSGLSMSNAITPSEPTSGSKNGDSHAERPTIDKPGLASLPHGIPSSRQETQISLVGVFAPNPSLVESDRQADPPHTDPPRLPPLPRRRLFLSGGRDLPPHLDGIETRTSTSSDSGMKCDTFVEFSDRITFPNEDGNDILSPHAASESSPQTAQEPLYNASILSVSTASFSDLSQPVAPRASSVTSMPRSGPPLPRPRKTSKPSSSSQYAPSPSTFPQASTGNLATRTTMTMTTMHAETQSAPPQPQSPETSLPVKRERSPSPVLANTGPRLVTDGCVRFAPLPPECRAGRSGYKDARQNWVAREVKKLRAQGLQPTRTFVRDDGLVIDWKSKVPVMSDTLCPPAITSSSDQIPILIPDSAHPAKKSKTIHDTATGNSSTENDPLHHSQVVPMERRDDAPYFAHTRPAVPRESIPAPGETIWRRISPPPRPSLSTSDAERIQTETHTGTLQSFSPTSRLPSIPVANASGSTSSRATNLPPNVDVIDLTKMEDDDPGLALDEALPTVTPPPLPSPTPPLPRRKKPSAPKDAPPPHISPDSSSDSTERPTEHSAAQAAYVAAISSTPAHSRPPLHVDVDAVQASALHFLHRFLTTFAEDRSALASAYSRAATFSFTSPTQSVEPDAVCSPTAYHRGRVNIVAALLDLPEDETADESAGEVEWDFLFAREAGDVLLICYPPARPQQRDKGKGKEKVQEKGKGKALAEARPGLLSCEQRFILRPRDWDEEDRDTPEMWPLVVVSHQMMFRRIQVLPG